MLEKVDFSTPPLSKDEYKNLHDQLIDKLVVLQQQARDKGVGLVVLFEGWNGAGKGSRISDLMYNLDARSTTVYVDTDIEKDEVRNFPGRSSGVTGYYPLMQDYWEALGMRGTMTIFDRGWYSRCTRYMMYESPGRLLVPDRAARHYLDSIRDFEHQLVADGYKVIKFFFHMTKKAQRKRLDNLHDDPVTRWRVPDKKLASAADYEEIYEMFDRLLEGSDYEFAPWVLINGEDKRNANIVIASTLIKAIEEALAEQEERKAEADAEKEKIEVAVAPIREQLAAEGAVEKTGPSGHYEGLGNAVAEAIAQAQHAYAPESSRFPIVNDYPTVDGVNHNVTLAEKEYRPTLKNLQNRLFRLENIMYQRRVPLMIMYEGWDAAGKGGNIKRVAQALDARAYTVFPSPAPTKPELMHPFLWRYWTRLPKAGHVGMYDRSWYGRVLVERVEGFATPAEWSRAYDEINEFEHDLVDWGAILLKFWVDVSPEEQLRRFHEREQNPAKHWKITDDDWRNREKYPQYKSAIDDMFRLTSTTYAPWIVLESDNKQYARIKALRVIVDALEERLGVQTSEGEKSKKEKKDRKERK